MYSAQSQIPAIAQTMPDTGAMLRHLPLAQRYAFDLCATLAHATGGSVLLHTTTPMAEALTMRLEPLRTLQLFEARSGDALAAQTAIWCGPQHARGAETAQELRRTLAASGRLLVISAGLLGGLAAGQTIPHVASRTLAAWLRGVGFRIEARYGFHSLLSIGWGLAAQLCERVGQHAQADRCHYAMRRTYVTCGALAPLAPLYLLVAQR